MESNIGHFDLRCDACGFFKHSHGPYSNICPVAVKGMLSQFRFEQTEPEVALEQFGDPK
jgi:hypothetical protein